MNAGGDMRNGEAGEGRLGTIIWLLVLVGLGIAAWNVAPVYIANYTFADKMTQIARTGRHIHDDRIMDMLMKAGNEEKLEGYITRQSCRMNTMETRRTVVCEYSRQVDVIPGWKHTFRFKNEADQPLI
jgi:hypothetical protein